MHVRSDDLHKDTDVPDVVDLPSSADKINCINTHKKGNYIVMFPKNWVDWITCVCFSIL